MLLKLWVALLVWAIVAVNADFCSRNSTCCTGRIDSCALPYKGSLCYCDEFCDRGERGDCCPDYLYTCHGATPRPEPLAKCYFNKRYYDDGENFKVDCNECRCERARSHMSVFCTVNFCLVDPSSVSEINRRQRRWRAFAYPEFRSWSVQDGFDKRLGTINARTKVANMKIVKQYPKGETLPREFDARVKWPGLISEPKDQGWCAASWAFSTLSVAQDRWSLAGKGRGRISLSPQHLVDCNGGKQRGCRGGFLTKAWDFIRRNGILPEKCYSWQGVQGQCRISRKRNATTARCDDANYQRAPLYRMEPVYRISGEETIMSEIYHAGPVQATMRVYKDFFSYQSGVYECPRGSRGDKAETHSVKLIGWGEEAGVKYWIAANSWGTWWGERGHFKIRRGVDECRIEEFILLSRVNTVRPVPSSIDAFFQVMGLFD